MGEKNKSPYSSDDGFRKYKKGEAVPGTGLSRNFEVTYADGSKEIRKLWQSDIGMLTSNGCTIEPVEAPGAKSWMERKDLQ